MVSSNQIKRSAEIAVFESFVQQLQNVDIITQLLPHAMDRYQESTLNNDIST